MLVQVYEDVAEPSRTWLRLEWGPGAALLHLQGLIVSVWTPVSRLWSQRTKTHVCMFIYVCVYFFFLVRMNWPSHQHHAWQERNCPSAHGDSTEIQKSGIAVTLCMSFWGHMVCVSALLGTSLNFSLQTVSSVCFSFTSEACMWLCSAEKLTLALKLCDVLALEPTSY